MFERTVSPEDLDKLAREREDAERAYNDALTRLDQALPHLSEAAAPAAGADEGGVTRLGAAAASLFRWLQRLLGPVVGAAFERQERINHTLVAPRGATLRHRRRRAAPRRGTVARIGTHLAETLTLQSLLVQYLQQITPFVDTRDREVAGLMRRINEDNGAEIAGLVAGLEELAARQRGLHESIQGLQGAQRVIGRELHRLRERFGEGRSAMGEPALAAPARGGGAAATEAGAATTGPTPPPASAMPPLSDAVAYAVFEDAFRGSEAEITGRQRRYLPCFEGATDVLDMGCGRGEFLELLRSNNIDARGIDSNPEMIERCRERGLQATHADALAYVGRLADESLGGLFSAQVVEHLEADYLLRLLESLHRTLRPGGRIVLETINPASWSAFFSSYLRDITHRQPLHPDTLAYLLRACGFVDVEIVYSAPIPDADRLQRVDAAPEETPNGAAARMLIETFNGNVDRLNGLLFGHQDYAAIGTRP